MPKTMIDREKFLASNPIAAVVGGQQIIAKPRAFSTGSLGWYATGKVLMEVDGKMVQVQVSGNFTICGTKPE